MNFNSSLIYVFLLLVLDTGENESLREDLSNSDHFRYTIWTYWHDVHSINYTNEFSAEAALHTHIYTHTDEERIHTHRTSNTCESLSSSIIHTINNVRFITQKCEIWLFCPSPSSCTNTYKAKTLGDAICSSPKACAEMTINNDIVTLLNIAHKSYTIYEKNKRSYLLTCEINLDR